MWDYLAPLTAIVLAIILAVWGIFPVLRRPCATVVVVIAVAANILASIFSVHSMHAAQDDIIASMTGGDSYPFITPEFSGSPQDQNKVIILGL
jgi:glucan phosphoethanolaminetransferase (alkaline phosphatase superfamily)